MSVSAGKRTRPNTSSYDDDLIDNFEKNFIAEIRAPLSLISITQKLPKFKNQIKDIDISINDIR